MKAFWKQEDHHLDNGLSVHIINRPGYHTFSCYVAIPVGSLASAYQIDGKPTPSGIAHFLEHRLFDTKKGDAFALFSALGCDANAFTTYEYTAYYFETANNLLEGLKILLNMTNHLTFDEEAVAKEKPIIVEELKMHLDQPHNRLYKGLLDSLVMNSPLKDEIVGDESAINKTTLDDLKRVFSTYYRLDKMHLFIFGDIPDTLLRDLQKIKLPSSDPDHHLERVVPSEEETIKKDYEMTKMDVPLPLIAVGMKTVKLKESLNLSNEQYEILNEVVTNLLFSDASQLLQEMHRENLVDTSVSGGLLSVDDVDIIYVMTSSHKKEQIIKKFQYFLSHLDQYLSPKDLKRAISACYGNALLNLDGQDFPYQLVSRYMRDIDYLKELQEYETIDYKIVKRYIEQWRNKRIAVHIVLNEEQ